MKNFASGARFAALSLALALATAFPALPTFAQTPTTSQLKETVVSATRTRTRTRTPTRADELVTDVVVINRAEIEKSAGRTLPEILARVPGVQFSSNGGLGKSSFINIRGSEARHTILLIDGVRYGSATLGTPIWDNIPVDMIERIEILKGPASALYGSEAVGGVVQIFMRKGVKGFNPYGSVSLGGEKFRQVGAGLTGGTDDVSYALGVQKTREAGFSAPNARVPFSFFNPDRDGFDQNAVNASLAYQINAAWKVDAGLVYADSVNHFDDGLIRDTRSAGLTTVTQLRYSQSVDSSQAIETAFLPSLFKTTQNQWTWQNDIDTPIGVALAGVEHLTQKVDSSNVYTVNKRDVTSYFLGLNGNAGKHSWQANVRNDNNPQFGTASTGFAGYGFSLTPAWRVNASYGTSFVAPSFNQLYFPASATFKGNPLLQPERGCNTDLGVAWSEAGQTVKLVKYDNKITDIIATVGIMPVNFSRGRIDGVTLAYDGSFGPLALRGSVDAMNPRNEATGKLLPRRAGQGQQPDQQTVRNHFGLQPAGPCCLSYLALSA